MFSTATGMAKPAGVPSVEALAALRANSCASGIDALVYPPSRLASRGGAGERRGGMMSRAGGPARGVLGPARAVAAMAVDQISNGIVLSACLPACLPACPCLPACLRLPACMPFFSHLPAEREPEVQTPALHGLLPGSLGHAAVGGVGLIERQHEPPEALELLRAAAEILVFTRALNSSDGFCSFPVPPRPGVGALV